MGKRAKTSRKGKKAWRANISTEDTDNYITRKALEERSGGPLDAIPSEALFFVDKSKDVTIEKKVNKHRNKVLHFESILQRNSLIPPLRAPLKRKTKRKDRDVAKPPIKDKPVLVVKSVDAKGQQETIDLWEDQDNALDSTNASIYKKTKKARVEAPAVEIDAPGCSYNPTFDDHQEALGAAVAQEMQKTLKRELEPEPVPRFVSGFPGEEDVYFLDVYDEGEDNDNRAPDQENGQSLGSRVVKVNKLTRAELNRKARRRENLRVELEKKKSLKVKKDVLRLPEIIEDINTEQKETENHRIRRNVAREERRAQGPPRLGKYKFKPEPVQVLLTEEVTGSMRTIKGCFTLVRDRFKSLQRRGLLEPRLCVSRKERKKRVMYEQGSKGRKEKEMHAAMEAEREARRQAIGFIPMVEEKLRSLP